MVPGYQWVELVPRGSYGSDPYGLFAVLRPYEFSVLIPLWIRPFPANLYVLTASRIDFCLVPRRFDCLQ